MKKLVVICYLLTLAILIFAQRKDNTNLTGSYLGQNNSYMLPKIFDARLENVRKKVIAFVNDGKVASMSIAIAKDGKIIWEEAFGYSDLENKVLATPHTKYHSASIAKIITSTALMTLVEKGLVDLDKPILNYVPQIKLRSFVGSEKEITVKQVLNHRSGIPSYCEFFFEDDLEDSRDILETIRRYGIITIEPGRAYIYSNLNYMLLGYLISEVSGTDYPHFLEQRVFKPLNMIDAKVFTKGVTLDHLAIGYTPDFKPIPRHRTSYPGASDILISAHDLIRFAMFHLKDYPADQEAILSDSTIEKMQVPYPSSNSNNGIGWLFDTNEAGYKTVYYGGEDPGSDNLMRLIPAEDLAMVVLCNGEIGDHLIEISEDICKALIPDFIKPKDVEQRTQTDQSDSQEQKIPEEYIGKWKGKIVAYDREIEVFLSVNQKDGFKISMSNRSEMKVDLSVITDSFLLGYFPGVIPTQDAKRYPDKIRLALIRQEGRLYGQATADQWIEERQQRNELSSWIELKKM